MSKLEKYWGAFLVIILILMAVTFVGCTNINIDGNQNEVTVTKEGVIDANTKKDEEEEE